jgi:lipoate-protein ligase A
MTNRTLDFDLSFPRKRESSLSDFKALDARFRGHDEIKEPWTWIPFLREPAQTTMDRDREIFKAVKEKAEKPTVRFYGWRKPAMSYGRTQGMDPAASEEIKSEGWEEVMRPTGGGKVFHGKDICFSVVWRRENKTLPWNVVHSYSSIHRWIQESLRSLGIESEIVRKKSANDNGWCFQSAVCFDLESNSRKIVGGAQWRDGNAALHQGSIQLAISEEMVDLFKKNFESFFNVRF